MPMPLMTGGKAVVECLAYNGTNAYDNLCLLCGPCNRRKGHLLTLSGPRKATQAEGRSLEKRW